MSDDINTTLNAIQTAFTELKSTNDTKLAEMATKGSVDTLIESKMAAINETITALEKKMARPAIGAGASQEETEHKSAWNAWSRKGVGEHELSALEKKAMVVGDANSAGVALPKVVESGIYSSLVTLSPIRSLANVIQVSSGDYRILTTDKNVGAGWVGETSARPETAAPTLAELKVPFGEVYANPFVSQTALDDLAFDVEGFIIDATAQKFAQMENVAFMSGDGVNKPQGILTTTGITTVKTGLASALSDSTKSADFVFNMIQTLPAAYRTGATFMVASSSMAAIRTLKDSTGNYLYSPVTADNAGKLGGYNVVESEDSQAIAANALPVIFGNFNLGYQIVDRVGIRTLRDPYSNKPYVGFYSTKRVGGMVRDKSAFVLLKVAA
ncbi:phage major capsid protein [Sphingomonas sp. Leaf242]|uniref:phage major capsid protein n=1 Tax=Sphingomonas sp. Leaf242 TaxID=1736304 RepID=UPI00071489CC|nr:phage major capsid protein [Sphingomonas sp. Leaf242]KQO06909.1 hypothetical protein ASF09_11655 [Sphingomonas sp. Leaf242]